jgi:HlyD family secretion protein
VELESAEAASLRAQADEKSADAAVAQAVAALKSDQTNLAKASIRSPIDGIVLTRQIEPGQTVAASLQTPVLFTLAENLTQMELQVDVDEADVGHVKPGQPAFFTVDAWPGREYPADIVRVGYGSQVTDNVVTYTTILKVSNDDLTLRPGMTATAEITTASRQNAVLVPNAALRFTPPQSDESTQSRSLVGSLLPHPPSRNNQKKATKANNGSQQVWVLLDNTPVAVPVKTGLSDGRHTEIVGADLQAGTQVITGMQTAQK